MPTPAIPATGRSGNVVEHSIASGEAWEVGSLVVLDGSEDLTECGTDPASILGWALAEVAAGDLAGDMAGLGIGCGVLVAREGVTCWMEGDNAPTKADLNQSYGVTTSGGVWIVDGTDTTNTRVYVHEIDTDRNMYRVSILAANRQAVA